MPDDLWPTNIADSDLVTPISILKQQAALLGEKTKELVKGDIVSQASGNLFIHSFFLLAPTLSYRYELFQVTHHVNFYPLNIRYINNTYQLKSESEFKDKLKEIFSAPHTLNTVHSILAQVRA